MIRLDFEHHVPLSQKNLNGLIFDQRLLKIVNRMNLKILKFVLIPLIPYYYTSEKEKMYMKQIKNNILQF